MTTLLIPARAASIQSAPIDFQLAQSILDRLGYTLRDLELEYGNICFAPGEITHELYHGSLYNTHNIAGFVRCENSCYYTDGNNNYKTPEQASLDLLDRAIVEDARYAIEIERASTVMPDYI